MLDKLKADFDEILELVKKCPPGLQELALKTILEHWFTNYVAGADPAALKKGTDGAGPRAATGVPDVVKPFLTANAITTQMLEKAFHPTGPGAQLLASEIAGAGKVTKTVNLGILLCVRRALDSGTFACTLKDLREMAIHYNCYDSPNFSTALKSNKNYFKPREKGGDLELSGPDLPSKVLAR